MAISWHPKYINNTHKSIRKKTNNQNQKGKGYKMKFTKRTT